MHNSDGFPYGKSTRKQLWPNFLAVVNIEPAMRSKYIALERICFTPTKPHLVPFMTQFAEKMQKLVDHGFVWRHPGNGLEITSKVFVVGSALDASARAPIMNMNYYNAEFGCSFCEIKCISRGKNQGPGKIYPFNEIIARRPPILRTADRVLEQANFIYGAARAERKSQGVEQPLHIKGIKGHPPLGLINHLDVVNSFSPDYLHSCLIGVVKRWTKHLLTSSDHSKKNITLV